MEIVRELSLRGILVEGDFVFEFNPICRGNSRIVSAIKHAVKLKLMDSIKLVDDYFR